MIKPEFLVKPITFVNTAEFCRSANHFLKHGCYTFAKEGTISYREYWDEEERRCKEGLEVGGVKITGEHYAYLNFGRIKITVGEGKSAKKYESFPRFLDMDYYYYHELELAKANKQGMIIAKSRRKGFSYKGAWNCAYEYTWYRESFSIIAAFMGDYANFTMGLALEMLNFLNKHTDFGKRRLIDTRTHIKAGFKEKVNGIEVESGYKSEIMTISFKDNPFKSIGKSSSVMLFEEAGKWPSLIEAYMLSKPLFMDGDIMIGIPIIYGTGGDMEGGTQDFCEMFYAPDSYGLRSYENVFDENATGECGWFVDDMWFKLPHVDKEGNSDRAKAESELDLQRELMRKTGNKRSYETFITQNPKTPAEAFLRTTGNIFPVADLLERLSFLQTHKEITNADYIGELVNTEDGKVEWRPNDKVYPIKKFPHKKSEDNTGCVVIYEMPYQDPNTGEIPFARYIAGCDPYRTDQAEYSDSIGSVFIFDRVTSRIVAEYSGRPATLIDFYENVLKIVRFYNANLLYENEIRGVFDYFERKGAVHLLADEPKLIRDVIQHTTVSRKKGMHMNVALKEFGEQLIKIWLLEESSEAGVMNLQKIRSIPLLQELISYNMEGNFDRVMALMMAIYLNNEKRRHKIDEEEPEKIFKIFDSNFFKRGFTK